MSEESVKPTFRETVTEKFSDFKGNAKDVIKAPGRWYQNNKHKAWVGNMGAIIGLKGGKRKTRKPKKSNRKTRKNRK